MGQIILTIKRMEDVNNIIVGSVVVYRQGQNIEYEVKATNIFYKQVLEDILNQPYYTIFPGPKTKTGYYANHSEMVYPNTIPFFLMLPDRLGWYGFVCNFINKKDIQKSINSFDGYDEFEDDDLNIVLKSLAANTQSQNWYYTNADGEVIVQRVPQGYIAMSQDGKILSAGRWLNANISKPDAKWRLVPAQNYTEQTYGGENIDNRKKLAEKLINVLRKKEIYHPGLHPQVYQHKDKEEPYKISENSAHWKHYQETYEKAIPIEKLIETQSQQPETTTDAKGSDILPKYVLAYSPKERLLVPGIQFPQYMKMASDWVLFDGKDIAGLSQEQKILQRGDAFKKGLPIHPGLISGAFSNAQNLKDNVQIDMKQAVPHDLSAIYQDRLFSLFKQPKSTGLKLDLGVEYDKDNLADQEYRAVPWTPEEQKKAEVINETDKTLQTQYFEKDSFGDTVIRQGLQNVQGIQHIAQGPNDFYSSEGLRPYQEYVVKLATDEKRYRIFGGPTESDGMFINMAQGLGKVATTLASDAVMRNRGIFNRSTLIVAPRAVTYNWASEIKKFRHEDSVVIDGTPEQRRKAWMQIMKAHAEGTPPPFIILGMGKVYFEADNTVIDDPEYNPSEDLKYIQLLSSGFKYGNTTVTEGAFHSLVVDETGLFTNPKANRHQALKAMVNWITGDKNKGIVWTLNGDIASNSAIDTLSEMAWVNSFVRKNFDSIIENYTHKPNPQSPRRFFTSAKAFLDRFKHGITSLTAKSAVGEERLIQEDLEVGMGQEFFDVYNEAFSKLKALYNLKQDETDMPLGNFKLGLIMMLFQSAFSVAKPQRLIEYDLNSQKMLSAVRSTLEPDDQKEFDEQIRRYMRGVTEVGEIGRMPRAQDFNTEERNKLWEEVIDPYYRQLMENEILSWHNPLTDLMKDQLDVQLKNYQPSDKPMKFGVAGLSRMAIENIYKRLIKEYDASQLRVNMIHGGLNEEDITRLVTDHNKIPGKDRNGNPTFLPPVVTLVTGAANYGVNLASDVAWRFVTWSAGKARQFNKRFHRNPYDYCVVSRIVPSGLPRYMRDWEDGKTKMAELLESATQNNDVEDMEEDFGKLILPLMEKGLMQHLDTYRPELIIKE